MSLEANAIGVRVISVDEFRFALRWYRVGDERLGCPHCRAQLGGENAVVIATRHCPFCSGAVLADPDPTPSHDLPSDAE